MEAEARRRLFLPGGEKGREKAVERLRSFKGNLIKIYIYTVQVQ